MGGVGDIRVLIRVQVVCESKCLSRIVIFSTINKECEGPKGHNYSPKSYRETNKIQYF